MKLCNECRTLKDVTEFYTNGSYKGSIKYKPRCKECSTSGTAVVFPLFECSVSSCTNLTKGTYCSKSCASFSRGTRRTCICGKECKRYYCSSDCTNLHAYAHNVNEYLLGKCAGWTGKTFQLKAFVRRFLKEMQGSACIECGWDELHPLDGSSLTEIDHIDGDAENCRPENLRVLCPNCHSKTPTFRARNTNSKRNRK